MAGYESRVMHTAPEGVAGSTDARKNVRYKCGWGRKIGYTLLGTAIGIGLTHNSTTRPYVTGTIDAVVQKSSAFLQKTGEVLAPWVEPFSLEIRVETKK